MTQMNLNDIHYFVEVANKGSLTSAAECIGISQPSLSACIKRLEKEVGTKLLHRFKTGVKLTPAGKTLLTNANQLSQLWNTVKNTAYHANNEIIGSITIGCHASVACYHLSESFFSLLKKHTALNVCFKHGLSREINEAIISMKIDMGVVVNPNYHPDLIITPLHQDKIGFWHALAPNELDLNNLTLLCDTQLKQTQELIKRFKSRGHIHRIIETSSFEVLAKLASKGIGVAVLPNSIATHDSHLSLQQILPDLYYLDEICLVYRNENRFIKSVAAIVDCLKTSS